MKKTQLLIAAGNSRVKKMYREGEAEWGELITVDIDPNCGAQVIWDMDHRPFPFGDEWFDEIHAYDCLEHWGRQGDWRGWFQEMAEYHRMLKLGGAFIAAVPFGEDRFADPGHTRFFGANHFNFLSQQWYVEQLAEGLQVSDYRWYWKKNFSIRHMSLLGDPVHHLAVILEK